MRSSVTWGVEGMTVPLPFPELLMDERKSIPFQIKCEPAWLDRVKFAADQLGISAASYIRMVTTQRMDADNVPRPKQKPKR